MRRSVCLFLYFCAGCHNLNASIVFPVAEIVLVFAFFVVVFYCADGALDLVTAMRKMPFRTPC